MTHPHAGRFKLVFSLLCIRKRYNGIDRTSTLVLNMASTLEEYIPVSIIQLNADDQKFSNYYIIQSALTVVRTR